MRLGFSGRHPVGRQPPRTHGRCTAGAVQAEQALAEVNAEHLALMHEVRALKGGRGCRAGLADAQLDLSVPRDVAVTADLTLADIRRLVERKELDD